MSLNWLLLFNAYDNENTYEKNWKGKKLSQDLLIKMVFGEKIVLQLRKMISFAPYAYLKYYKYGSVHEGYSEFSDMGIILKGKCEPKFSL